MTFCVHYCHSSYDLTCMQKKNIFVFWLFLNLWFSSVHTIFCTFFLHYFLQKTRLVSTVNCIRLAGSACGQNRARFVWRHSRNAEPHFCVQTYGRSATVSDSCSDSYDLRLSCWLFSVESDKWEASETGSWLRNGETLPAWAESKWQTLMDRSKALLYSNDFMCKT